MGIHRLMSLLQDKAPDCVRKVDIKLYTGRTIACDASMAIYQFLISTQGYSEQAFSLTELTDKDGNKTGHLVGLFNRSIQFLENGIKPVWVFDGKPPKFKNGELARRKKQKEEAKEKLEDAKELGDLEKQLQFSVRTTYVTQQMIQDAKTMLKLMGMPIIEAPSEAEATCSALNKAGKVFATATEDLDALTFGTNILLRSFNNKKEPITEVNRDEMLKQLDLTDDQFIDLCILCGCDYTESIDGIGPVSAYKLIKEYGNIEKIIEVLNEENESGKRKKKYGIPKDFYYQESRSLFKEPEVIEVNSVNLQFEKPDQDGLRKFLVEEKGFSLTRVDAGLKKIQNKATSGVQSSLESYFGKPSITKRKDDKNKTVSKGSNQKGAKGRKK